MGVKKEQRVKRERERVKCESQSFPEERGKEREINRKKERKRERS